MIFTGNGTDRDGRAKLSSNDIARTTTDHVSQQREVAGKSLNKTMACELLGAANISE